MNADDQALVNILVSLRAEAQAERNRIYLRSTKLSVQFQVIEGRIEVFTIALDALGYRDPQGRLAL